MKNINKSNAMELVGKEIVNVKNNVIGVVANIVDGKYTVVMGDEEKAYSLSTLIRNWKINENETEEIDEVVLTVEEGVQEIETEEITNEEVENETEETANEEVEIETEEIINENTKIETEEMTNEEVENETEEITNEDAEIETEEITSEEVENETEETANELNEKFEIETENRGIIDNIKETEGKVKITGHLYGVPVKFDKINQTTVWKTLNRLYDNRKNENDEYSLEDKKYLVRQLKQLDEKVFAGAFRCLVSKTKQNYIEELMK